MKNKFLYYLFGVFRRHHKTYTSSIIMMVIGIIVFLLDYLNVPTSFFSVQLKWYIKAIPFTVALVLYSISIIALYYKSYPRRNELNFESILLKWHILNERGDFASSIYYSIINNSNAPISEIRGEREGFSRKLDRLPVKYDLSGESRNNSSVDISFHFNPTFFERTIDAVGSTTTVFTWEWCLNLSPALRPKEKINILRTLVTEGTEQQAFKNNGSWSGWRIIYPTLYLEFNIIAPPNYRFCLLTFFCLDDTGAENIYEKKYLARPKILCHGSLLVWRIFFPLREHRYRIKYRLEKELT